MISKNHSRSWSYIRSGAVAGIISTLIFTIAHHIFIANIWFSFPLMAVAGIICGVLIAWSYELLFNISSAATWAKYNFIFIIMFLLLGLMSVMIFEPVTTLADVMSNNQRPDKLIAHAMPLTISFILASTILISLLCGEKISHYLAILLTCSVLVLILGINVSIIGLVDIPKNSFYLIFELFALIILIMTAYAIMFLILERKRLINKN